MTRSDRILTNFHWHGKSPVLLSSCVLWLLLGGAVSAGQVGVKDHDTLPRPRLLIRERDALTGLDVLRARYAMGLRPAEDIAGWALSYLITKDGHFAHQAVEEMKRTHPPERVGSRTYTDYIRWSLAFDWLYSAPEFDETLKKRIAGELLQGAEKMMADEGLAEPTRVAYHNYNVRFLTLALFALTAIEGEPSTEPRARALRERMQRSFDNVLAITQFITPQGGYHESMDYARITFLPMALLAELRRTTMGNDPARQFTAYRHYIDAYLYKVLPDGSTSRADDQEWPFLMAQDNDVLGYLINRFKDPYAAWVLRRSGWTTTSQSYLPILKFLWNDPTVEPRDPALTIAAELPRQHVFDGIGEVVMRDGWGPSSTWIEFTSGPYLAKHQHLDQNQFSIYHKGYLAIDSGEDYTDIESPHYLNYYRRTIAHNTMLIYEPGEEFFWGTRLWPAANDGGQRMDSSRYWNTISSRADWERTRNLWDLAHLEATEDRQGEFQYARGNATQAYHASKLSLYTRELIYLPKTNVLVVFDRVRTPNPAYKKVWLLHGVNEPQVETSTVTIPTDIGQGGTRYTHVSQFTFTEGDGALHVHPLLPRDAEVVKRGGPGWEFWTPGNETGGEWGSGRNWPSAPGAGGPLPEEPFLQKMWHTFYGNDFARILPSNQKKVVPGAWRIELSPGTPAQEDVFLNVLEIGAPLPHHLGVALVEGENLIGARITNNTIVLFAPSETSLQEGAITLSKSTAATLLLADLKPHTKYEIHFRGHPTGKAERTLIKESDQAGILTFSLRGYGAGQWRFRQSH